MQIPWFKAKAQTMDLAKYYVIRNSLRGCSASKGMFSVPGQGSSQETWESWGTRVIKPGLHSCALQWVPCCLAQEARVLMADNDTTLVLFRRSVLHSQFLKPSEIFGENTLLKVKNWIFWSFWYSALFCLFVLISHTSINRLFMKSRGHMRSWPLLVMNLFNCHSGDTFCS